MEKSHSSFWACFVQTFDLLVLARVPLLLVFAGAVMAYYVPQFQELFDLALKRTGWAFWMWLFTGALSLVAWYSARTLFSFEWPRRVQNPRVQKMLGKVLPRVLAGLLPLVMALAFSLASSTQEEACLKWILVSLFVAQAIALVLFTVYRRSLIRNTLIGSLGRPLGVFREKVQAEPSVGRLRRWSDLGPVRYFHVVGVIVLLVSWVIGYCFPDWIDLIGSPGLIIGAFMMLVWASTAPVYFAARKRIPLVTALVVWASVITLSGLNDNHAVRLNAGANSDQRPPPGLTYSAGKRGSLAKFMREWWDDPRRQRCNDQVYFVSSEGGGIRAALWTVLVLSELQHETEGRFWDCTMAVSGVSGGSLGLGSFAAFMREREDQLPAENPLVHFLEDDFLAPVLASMFGADLFQRFLPFRWFTDRGQALEDSWVRGYRQHVLNDVESPSEHAGLAMPLADTVRSVNSERWRTAVFLNTTLVDSGLRLIQHPFSELNGEDDVSVPFPGASDAATWLPEELPLFSAMHNSARFTLVSPAGTILRREGDQVIRPGQVVDGGYFENSGATTLQALISGYRELVFEEGGPEQFRVVHISNGDSVEPFAPNGADACRDVDPAPESAPLFGELRAPLIAILSTRDARGQFARQALLDQVQHLKGKLWHYRLCKGQHPIPLGWTIGSQVSDEMTRQLSCSKDKSGCDHAADMAKNTREIAAQWNAQ